MKLHPVVFLCFFLLLISGCIHEPTKKEQRQAVLALVLVGAAAGGAVAGFDSADSGTGSAAAAIAVGAAVGLIAGELIIEHMDRLDKNIRTSYFGKKKDIIVERQAPDRLKLTMANRSEFEPGSASLSRHARRTLAYVASKIKRSGNRSPPFTIIGHANDGGSDKGNMDLSRRRANTVAEFLRDHTDVPVFVAKGVGDEPIHAHEGIKGDAYRRVEIVIRGVPSNQDKSRKVNSYRDSEQSIMGA